MGKMGPGAKCVRAAIISSPRCGNFWLQYLLRSLYAVPIYPVHHPDDVPWSALPDSAVVTMHQHYTTPLAATLHAHRFRVLTLTRHPLDMLISILHFAQHEPTTARWLAGEGGSEDMLIGATPLDASFRAYALGPRFRALLAISGEWRDVPGVVHVRYESLQRDAVGELGRVADAFGGPLMMTLAAAVEANQIEKLRPTTANEHFWQGQIGLWRRLLPREMAREIADAHADLFVSYGYVCDPDDDLQAVDAHRNWQRLLASKVAGEVPLASQMPK
jgi:hypothetical protein